jgi:hypothetical protein
MEKEALFVQLALKAGKNYQNKRLRKATGNTVKQACLSDYYMDKNAFIDRMVGGAANLAGRAFLGKGGLAAAKAVPGAVGSAPGFVGGAQALGKGVGRQVVLGAGTLGTGVNMVKGGSYSSSLSDYYMRSNNAYNK